MMFLTLFFYYLQLLQRAKSREHRLQEALRAIQGNAALVEELLSWLTDAQVCRFYILLIIPYKNIFHFSIL